MSANAIRFDPAMCYEGLLERTGQRVGVYRKGKLWEVWSQDEVPVLIGTASDRAELEARFGTFSGVSETNPPPAPEAPQEPAPAPEPAPEAA